MYLTAWFEKVIAILFIGFGSLVSGSIGSNVVWRLFLRWIAYPGWSSLERSKELWQLIPDLFPAKWYGRINPNAASYSNSPKICEAKALLRNAIDQAPASNRNPLQAMVNKAVAWRELGLLYRAVNEFEKSQEAYNKSLHILEGLGGITSTSLDVLTQYRETVFRIGELFHTLGNYNIAVKKYRESLNVDEILQHDDPAGEQYTRALLQEIQNRT